MKKYPFGDLKILDTEDGFDIDLLETGPECDPSLDNAVSISLFTDECWWGNCYFTENDIIGSDISKIRVVNPTGRKNLERYIQSSLDWIVTQGYASEVETSVSINKNNEYSIAISFINRDGTKENKYWKYKL